MVIVRNMGCRLGFTVVLRKSLRAMQINGAAAAGQPVPPVGDLTLRGDAPYAPVAPTPGGRVPPDPFEVLKSVPLLRRVPEADLRARAMQINGAAAAGRRVQTVGDLTLRGDAPYAPVAPTPGGRVPPDPFEVLKSVPLLRRVPEADLRALAPLVRERSHPRGSVILSEGDPGEALFLIRSGQVKVTVVAEDGREVILSVLGPGNFFGEMALVDDEPRSAHVIAMEDSTLLQLRREDFRARLRSAPELAISLLCELSRRLDRKST